MGLILLIWVHMLTCVDVDSSCIYKFFYVGWVGISDLDGVFVLRVLCYDCLLVGL